MGEQPMWRRYLRFLGPDTGADVEEELRFHLEMRTREYVARGMDPERAREAAMRRFGDVERVRRAVEAEDAAADRTKRRRDWFGSFGQDVRYAVRGFRRSPGFTAVAVLTLGLGIGGTAAIFSVVNAVMLRPLPYAEPDRVVKVTNRWEGTPEADLSPPELFDYAAGMRTLSAMGGYAVGPANLTGGESPERLRAGYLSHGAWAAFGVEPAAGRVFTAEEDRPGGEAVAVLSHGLWTRRFGGSPGVVGERVLLDGEERVVIGVMPAEFRLPADLREGEGSDVFLPLGLDAASAPNRGSHFLEGVGRLRPGATVEQASAEVARLAAGFTRAYPDDYAADSRFGARVTSLRDAVMGPTRPLMLVLLGSVALVLLIACANVANLLMVRADGRRRELAVRGALGASGWRVARQLLVESLVLAGAGGALGLGLAVAAVRAFPLVQPPDLPRVGEVTVDPTVLAFAAGLSLLTALLFGLAPALRSARSEPNEGLREGARGTVGVGRRRLRSALVAGEIALAMVLLVGAGLLIRTVVELNRVDPGFRTDGVLTMRVTLPVSEYAEHAEVAGFYDRLVARVEALPGVERAGAVSNLPLATSLGDLNFEIDGRPVPEDAVSPRADWQVVTPGYREAVGMRLVRGRWIEARDHGEAPGAVVLNESLARRYWPGRDPIGERMLLGGGAGPGWVTVVGIVGDVRHASLSEPPHPEMYLSHAQFRFWNGGGPARSLTLAIRTSGEPMEVANAARAEIRSLDPNLPVAEVQPLAAVRSESVARPRFATVLLAAFAAIALLLAAIGVYGTLAYVVAQRTREIGVRLALGAGIGRIVRMVVRQGLTMAGVGVGAGLLAALALSRLVESLLYGVAPTDAATFVAVPAILLGVAFIASWLPARRASRVEPVVAMRSE